MLSDHFLGVFSRKYGKEEHALTPAALAALSDYPWPGNVRELAHVIERAVLLSDGPLIGPDLFSLPGLMASEAEGDSRQDSLTGLTLEQVEQLLISRALTASGGNVSEAARRLGISREALRYRLQKHAIAPGDPK